MKGQPSGQPLSYDISFETPVIAGAEKWVRRVPFCALLHEDRRAAENDDLGQINGPIAAVPRIVMGSQLFGHGVRNSARIDSNQRKPSQSKFAARGKIGLSAITLRLED